MKQWAMLSSDPDNDCCRVAAGFVWRFGRFVKLFLNAPRSKLSRSSLVPREGRERQHTDFLGHVCCSQPQCTKAPPEHQLCLHVCTCLTLLMGSSQVRLFFGVLVQVLCKDCQRSEVGVLFDLLVAGWWLLNPKPQSLNLVPRTGMEVSQN